MQSAQVQKRQRLDNLPQEVAETLDHPETRRLDARQNRRSTLGEHAKYGNGSHRRDRGHDVTRHDAHARTPQGGGEPRRRCERHRERQD